MYLRNPNFQGSQDYSQCYFNFWQRRSLTPEEQSARPTFQFLFCVNVVNVLTFTLIALLINTLQQFATELTDGGCFVRVHYERVWDFDNVLHGFVDPHGSALVPIGLLLIAAKCRAAAARIGNERSLSTSVPGC